MLADCLAHAIDQGAERLVDLATLTGAIVSALGKTYAGLFADDDAWAEQVARGGRARRRAALAASRCTPSTTKAIKGRYADIANAVENRQAGSIVAAEFLRRFTGDVPWAHLDIAGTADDNGKPYTPKGGAGFGVRTLVELARATAAG